MQAASRASLAAAFSDARVPRPALGAILGSIPVGLSLVAGRCREP